MRMVGHAYGFEKVAVPPICGAASGEHTASGAEACARHAAPPSSTEAGRPIGSPLEGRRRARPSPCGRGRSAAAARRPRRDGDRGQQRGLRRLLPADVFLDVATAGSGASRSTPAYPDGLGAARPGARRRRAAAQHALRQPRSASASTECAQAPEPGADLLPPLRHDSSRMLPGNDQTRRRWRHVVDGRRCRGGNIPIWLEHVARRHRQRLPLRDAILQGSPYHHSAPVRASSCIRRS